MARVPRARVEATEPEVEIDREAATVAWCLIRNGLNVRGWGRHALPSGPRTGREVLTLRIDPRFRLPQGFADEGIDLSQFEPDPFSNSYRRSSFGPNRQHLTVYADKIPTAIRALMDLAENRRERGVFELCRILAEQGVVAVEHRHPNGGGTSLWFPRQDIQNLFLGSLRRDIAEAVFVLVSYDDPRKGIDAVRRLR